VTRLETALGWRGHTMYDRDGEKIGRIQEIYLDGDTDAPEWALVSTSLFRGRSTFVPIAGARPEDDGVHVPFERVQVKDAPTIDPDAELSQQHEKELYAHYGMASPSSGLNPPVLGTG
jgi:sporulation protein YlmC with PRC-barrel domain